MKGKDATKYSKNFNQSANCFLNHFLGVKNTQKAPLLKVGSKCVSLDFIHHRDSKGSYQDKEMPLNKIARTHYIKQEDNTSDYAETRYENKEKQRNSVIQKLRKPSQKTKKTTSFFEDDIISTPYPMKKRKPVCDEQEFRIANKIFKKEIIPSSPSPRKKSIHHSPVSPSSPPSSLDALKQDRPEEKFSSFLLNSKKYLSPVQSPPLLVKYDKYPHTNTTQVSTINTTMTHIFQT